MIHIGVDVGGSGCKVGAFTLDGQLVAFARAAYGLHSPRPGWRELDPDAIFAAVVECLQSVAQGGVGAQVHGIAVSAMGEALVPMDARHKVVRPVQASFDSRSAAVLGHVTDRIDVGRMLQETGVPLHGMFSLYKLCWLMLNNPEAYERIETISTFADWVAFKLSGCLVMDHSSASRTSVFDIWSDTWAGWIAEALGIRKEIFPELAPSGIPIGTIGSDIASLASISPAATIATGAHDQICCALGAGVVGFGEVMNSMGSTDSVVTRVPSASPARVFAEGGHAIGRNATGDYTAHGFVMSTGSTVDWFVRTFRTGNSSPAGLDAVAARLGRPSGLHFLPHLVGSGTPYVDISSTGAIAGLTTETTPEELYLGVLEGINLELLENVRAICRYGDMPEFIVVIGGASRSDSYLQLKADIFGIPVRRPAITEAGVYGASILAAKASGVIDDVGAQASRTVRTDKIFEPNWRIHESYADIAYSHSCMYRATKSLNGVAGDYH